MANVASRNASPVGDRQTRPTTSGSEEPSSATAVTIALIPALIGMTLAFAWLAYGYLTIRGDFPGEQVMLTVWLWFSTIVVLVSSIVLHYSLGKARVMQTAKARRALFVSVGLGYVFIALQVPGLIELVTAHRFEADPATRLYRMIFMIVVLHAAHVLGGATYMSVAAWRIRGVAADRQAPMLRNLCIFWHYLAIIWLALFVTFLIGTGLTPIHDL